MKLFLLFVFSRLEFQFFLLICSIKKSESNR